MPTKAPDKKMRKITVSLTPQQVRWLTERADAEAITVADLVRRLLSSAQRQEG